MKGEGREVGRGRVRERERKREGEREGESERKRGGDRHMERALSHSPFSSNSVTLAFVLPQARPLNQLLKPGKVHRNDMSL